MTIHFDGPVAGWHLPVSLPYLDRVPIDCHKQTYRDTQVQEKRETNHSNNNGTINVHLTVAGAFACLVHSLLLLLLLLLLFPSRIAFVQVDHHACRGLSHNSQELLHSTLVRV